VFWIIEACRISSSLSLFVNRQEKEPHSRYLFSLIVHSACGLPERLPLIQNVGRPGVVSIWYRWRTVELPACNARRRVIASCPSFLRAVWTVIPRAAATALAASPVRRSSGEATNKPHTVVSTSCSGPSSRLNSGWPSRIACCSSSGSSPGCVPIAEGNLLIAELSWLGSVAARSASVKSPQFCASDSLKVLLLRIVRILESVSYMLSIPTLSSTPVASTIM
jgi:hypothetical protein